MQAWYEDEAFWELVGPKIFDAQRWEQAEAEVDHLLDLVQLTPDARILDMPCGTGRHLLELARRGFTVTGMDRTKPFLAEARRIADDEGLGIRLIESDMRCLAHEKSFDLILNLYTSFGYFVDPADDLTVLRRMHAALAPGGRLVMETMSKEILARIFQERDWREDADGSLWLEERSIRSGWDWADLRWIIISADGARREARFGHRLYSASELVGVLRQAGFAGVATHGDLTGRPYDQEATRLVAVARR